MKKKLPVGIEDFKEIRTEGFYYIDKTGLLKELLHSWGKVNLFTRPRRFGKSLNMSMLKSFFEIGCEEALFDGLIIAEETTLCEAYMGKFPVLSISLKDVNGSNFQTARAMMCSVIGNEALRFAGLMDSDVFHDSEKEMYRKLTRVVPEEADNFVMSDSVLMGSGARI